MKSSSTPERRSLIEGLQQTPPAIDPQLEQEFVFRAKGPPSGEGAATVVAPPPAAPATTARSPISTRIRSDYAEALKRASLERQLSKTEPHTLQDILEQAIEPWLKTHGYIS